MVSIENRRAKQNVIARSAGGFSKTSMKPAGGLAYTVALMSDPAANTRSRFFVMFALVLAGELIFSLPFHVPRYFRPTVLEAFDFSNANLGDVFAVYGITAMLAYFPGGAIADRFSARKLMTVSLVATAAGGFYMTTLPGITAMSLLYGYWGVTTILLFWAAMIRATRQWGGAFAQGRAFGILDGGRGLVAAMFATAAVWCLSQFLPDAASELNDADRREALRAVIGFYSIATLSAGALVWWFVPDASGEADIPRIRGLSDLREVLALRVVWLQAAIVIYAYCGYKGLDNYSLYAFEILDMSEAEAAGFTAISAYIRPVAAVLAGFLADRIGVSRLILGLFAVLAGSYTALGVLVPEAQLLVLVYANLFLTFCGVFALRGVYFALLEETRVPDQLTGAAVGLISLVGYTPDIFFAPIAGRLLDATPGIGGHQHYFILLAGIAIIGLVTAICLARRARVTGKLEGSQSTRS